MEYFFNNYKKGFTLLEMIMVVMLIALLFGMATTVYYSTYQRNDLDIAAITTVQGLRNTQARARSAQGSGAHGVYVQSSSITLFQGSSYATRDTAYDEVYEIPATITIAGTQEIVFSGLNGKPQVTGSLVLTAANNESRTITINDYGVIDYQ